jgi:MGT family glycosyltransferase
MPQGFDFPREDLPPTFHYVGPIRRPGPAAPPFPWERLNGRPHIYASLGTLQNSREPVFRCIAEACRDLPVQLVISHGGGLSDAQAAALPGSPVVVQYAPQPDVIAGAALTITHAGLNTVLDSLSQGVPLVVMPITYEQPAIGRRVERVGAGRMLALDAARPERLRGTVREVLERQSFRQAASQVATDIRQTGGVAAAGDLIEAATVGRPG